MWLQIRSHLWGQFQTKMWFFSPTLKLDIQITKACKKRLLSSPQCEDDIDMSSCFYCIYIYIICYMYHTYKYMSLCMYLCQVCVWLKQSATKKTIPSNNTLYLCFILKTSNRVHLIFHSWNIYISMRWCKKGVTPLLTHWGYVFLALTHRYLKYDSHVWKQ